MTAPAGSVVILDEICVPRDREEEWLRRWRSEYLPSAGRRGLRLRAIWRASTRDPEQAQIVVYWSLPRAGRYWAARWTATEDPEVSRFWRWTDAVAVHRERRVLEDRGLDQCLEH